MHLHSTISPKTRILNISAVETSNCMLLPLPTLPIINREHPNHKVNTFLTENNFIEFKMYPTCPRHKQTHCNHGNLCLTYKPVVLHKVDYIDIVHCLRYTSYTQCLTTCRTASFQVNIPQAMEHVQHKTLNYWMRFTDEVHIMSSCLAFPVTITIFYGLKF
jgi:hypothetical protein